MDSIPSSEIDLSTGQEARTWAERQDISERLEREEFFVRETLGPCATYTKYPLDPYWT